MKATEMFQCFGVKFTDQELPNVAKIFRCENCRKCDHFCGKTYRQENYRKCGECLLFNLLARKVEKMWHFFVIIFTDQKTIENKTIFCYETTKTCDRVSLWKIKIKYRKQTIFATETTETLFSLNILTTKQGKI